MYLDNDEAGAGVVGALEVDVGLVVGYVETLDGRALLEGGGGCSDCQSGEKQEWADDGGQHVWWIKGRMGVVVFQCSKQRRY